LQQHIEPLFYSIFKHNYLMDTKLFIVISKHNAETKFVAPDADIAGRC
jgi:hypothetical protein